MGLQLLFKRVKPGRGPSVQWRIVVGATTSKARSALSPVRQTARTWTEDLGDPLLEWGWSGSLTHTGA